MLAALQVAYALRRMRAVPGRTLVALLAFCLAWAVILEIQSEVRALRQRAQVAGQLAGQAGYRIEMQRVQHRQAVLPPVAIPAPLAALASRSAHVHVVQLQQSYPVVRSDRDGAMPVNLLFYRIGAIATQPGVRGFPPCSLVRAPRGWENAGFLVFAQSNWRCRLVPLPAGMAVLEFDRTQAALVLPSWAMHETIGRSLDATAEIIWLGQSDRGAMDAVLNWRASPDAPVSISRIGQQLADDNLALSITTRKWLLVASMALVCALALYIQGSWRALTQELCLRLCLGIPRRAILGWLFIDIASQSLCLVWTSFALALGWCMLSNRMMHDAHVLLASISGAVLAVVTALSLLAVTGYARSAQLARIVKS